MEIRHEAETRGYWQTELCGPWARLTCDRMTLTFVARAEVEELIEAAKHLLWQMQRAQEVETA